MTMPFSMRSTKTPANLMGEYDGKINLPHSFQTAPDSRGLWLVPKKYSTQNTAVMFVQYISPI